MNVLIVDDEDAIRISIKILADFEKLHIDNVFEAASVEEAKSILENNSIEILLTDIEMPEENGLVLMEYVHSNYPNTKTIVISGYQKFQYVVGSMRNGALDYLLKPIDPYELNSLLYVTVEKINSELKAANISDDQNFEDLRAYIEHNYFKNLSLSDLADKFGFNASYISRRFKQKYSLSIIDYLSKIRIQNACTLLKNTDLKILDIAVRVGYSDEKYFSRVFSKYMRMSPREYRLK